MLAGASTARAAGVMVGTVQPGAGSSSLLRYRAAPGEQDAVTVTREDRTIVFADSGAPLRSPDGSCEISADARSARCTVPDRLTGLDVELGDGDDRATNDVAPGGPETFDAPNDDYVLEGGPGDDVLIRRRGGEPRDGRRPPGTTVWASPAVRARSPAATATTASRPAWEARTRSRARAGTTPWSATPIRPGAQRRGGRRRTGARPRRLRLRRGERRVAHDRPCRGDRPPVLDGDDLR